MSNIHTSSACRVNLVTSVVFLPHCQLIKLSCDMFGGTRICIPISVDAIRVGDEVNLLLFLTIFLVPIPAVPGAAGMVLITNQALGVITLMLLLVLLRWWLIPEVRFLMRPLSRARLGFLLCLALSPVRRILRRVRRFGSMGTQDWLHRSKVSEGR